MPEPAAGPSWPEVARREVKVYPGVFRAAKRGLRTLELLDDAGYQIGDELVYREFDAAEEAWTGDECSSLVKLLCHYPQDGVPRGKVRLLVELIRKPIHVPGDLTEERRRRDAQGTEDL